MYTPAFTPSSPETATVDFSLPQYALVSLTCRRRHGPVLPALFELPPEEDLEADVQICCSAR